MTLRLSPDAIVAESSSPLLTIAPWWERCRLGDVAEITNGAAFKSAQFNTQGHGLPLIRIRDVGQAQASTHYSGDYEPRHLVESGDLIVGMDGDFRIARWNGNQSLLNQRVCRIRVRAHDRYSDRFLEYVVQPYLDEIHKVTSAVTVKHLSPRTINDLPIPLPPRSEQERLVAAIEEHLSRLDAAEATLRQTLTRLDTLRSSILTDSFHTHREIPAGWEERAIAEVARVQLGRQRSPQHHSGEQMRPYLRAANVSWNGLLLDDVKTMNFDDADFEKYRLAPGDLLLNEASGSPNEVGKPAIWDGQIEDCCFQNTLLRLRPQDVALRYLYWYCHLSARSGEFGEAGRGVNIRHLGKQGLARFPIRLAPRDIQDGIAARIDVQMQSAEELQRTVRVALDRVATLRRAVLAEAFSGRLVPQDPDDEPASVLLERIAASRPSRPTRRKART